MKKGIAGKIANFFIDSKITILLMAGLMLIGVYSSTLIPREEEPQINIPMADIMVGYPERSQKWKQVSNLWNRLSLYKGVSIDPKGP